jgi:hypothetical protein
MACPKLTSIPYIDKQSEINILCCHECPWINHGHNPDYENNIKKLLVMQSFCKKNFRYFVFSRWVKSQEFQEWFYSPENAGGRKHKKIMEREYA